jgi:hypothetical protein
MGRGKNPMREIESKNEYTWIVNKNSARI